MVVDTTRNVLAFEFAQAAVVDPEKPLAYLLAPEARIDEVDLSSGKVLATSTRGARPLLLYDAILLAQVEPREQGETLQLVGLNAKDLTLTFKVDVPLPNGVHPSIDDRLGRSFYVGARPDAGDVVIQWRSVERRITGIPSNEPAHIAAGWVRIDPNAGRLTSSGSGEAPVREEELPAAVRALANSSVLANKPCRLDDLIAAIQYGEEGAATSVMLRRWNGQTGGGLPEVKLFTGEFTFRGLSADCHYVLASRPMEGWLWSIYSMMTGERVTELHMSAPAAQFFIRSDSLFYIAPATLIKAGGQLKIDQPRRLLAIGLRTGGELWSRPIRETTYLGPYPARLPNPLTR